MKFYLRGKQGPGGGFYDNRFHVQGTEFHQKIITVETFDFGQWLKHNFSVNDFVIVSLDIEAAEYEILDQMFKDGTIKYVDRLYIELHAGIPEYNKFLKKERKLIEKLDNLGILKGRQSVDHMIDSSCKEWVPGWVDGIE